MNFLPDNYKSPISSNNYLKMNEGENRIRILSQPIMGWEDWVDNKPVRYPLDAKPSRPADPQKAIRYFWAFIVHNVIENQIQIMQITQNGIIKAIESFCKDSDWGNPYAYDIKIRKSGKGMETQYVVSPVPHKPIDPSIAEMFHAKPCKLDALFVGADPFSKEWHEYTPLAITMPTAPAKEAPKPVSLTDMFITDQQAEQLDKLVSECDPKRQKEIRDFLKVECGGDDLCNLKKERYAAILDIVMKRRDEFAKKAA